MHLVPSSALLPFLFWGRIPFLKQTTQKKGVVCLFFLREDLGAGRWLHWARGFGPAPSSLGLCGPSRREVARKRGFRTRGFGGRRVFWFVPTNRRNFGALKQPAVSGFGFSGFPFQLIEAFLQSGLGEVGDGSNWIRFALQAAR